LKRRGVGAGRLRLLCCALLEEVGQGKGRETRVFWSFYNPLFLFSVYWKRNLFIVILLLLWLPTRSEYLLKVQRVRCFTKSGVE
jgi:hypothetical protein